MQIKKRLNHKLGFTLIELILVVGIIGMLATAGIAILNPFEQFKKATDSRIKSDLTQVQRGLEVYYQDKGQYPLHSASTYRIVDSSLGTINWGSPWGTYMSLLPKDPDTSHTYVYYSNGQSYYLYANLTRGVKDSQVCNNGNACSSMSGNGISATACGATCNFAVSSPDKNP